MRIYIVIILNKKIKYTREREKNNLILHHDVNWTLEPRWPDASLLKKRRYARSRSFIEQEARGRPIGSGLLLIRRSRLG